MPLLEAPNLCTVSHSHINLLEILSMFCGMYFDSFYQFLCNILDLIRVEQEGTCRITSVQ